MRTSAPAGTAPGRQVLR